MDNHPLRRWSLTILLGILALLFLSPMVLTITNSFCSDEEIIRSYGPALGTEYMADTTVLHLLPQNATVSQYEKLLRNVDYRAKYWNSVVYAFLITVFQTAVSALAAYGFLRYRSRLRTILLFGYAVLMLMPYQVTLVPNYLVSRWLGLYNTRWAILFPGIFSVFGVYLLTRFMAQVPKDCIEAAQLDGAGEWLIFWRLCLPQCKSALWTVAMLIFFDSWNMVEQPLVLLHNELRYPLSVYLSRINTDEPGTAFAAAVVYMLPCLLIFITGQRHLKENARN